MTATPSQVRAALKTRLESISGLKVYAFAPASISVPCAAISYGNGEFLTYATSMDDDSDDMDLTITVFVQGGQRDEQTTAEALDAFLAKSSASSIYAAVEADPTLGGVVDSCSVMGASDYGSRVFGEGENAARYPSVQFAVEVLL
jgi:hypothetical protein